MSKYLVSPNRSKTKFYYREKLSPIEIDGKHFRTQKLSVKTSRTTKSIKTLKILSSHSPKRETVEAFLQNFDSLCDKTRKNIFATKNGVLLLEVKIQNEKMNPDNTFKTQNEILMSQCRDFVYERKFSLKSKEELAFTKNLQRSVTKKLLG
jgi:hypothetical protein